MNVITKANPGSKPRTNQDSNKIPLNTKAFRWHGRLPKAFLFLGLFLAAVAGAKFLGTRGANLETLSAEMDLRSEFVATGETSTSRSIEPGPTGPIPSATALHQVPALPVWPPPSPSLAPAAPASSTLPATQPSPGAPSIAHQSQREAAASSSIVVLHGSPMAAGFDSTTPSASVEQSIPAMPPLPFTAQFPVPGNESSTNEIANWRLLALKAIHDTNSAARLIQSAQRKQISEEAWPAISVALVSETTTNEQILTNSALSTVESFSEAELNRRLDIIEALQAVTKSNVAQRWLQVACIWLKETLDSAEAKHQLSRLAQL